VIIPKYTSKDLKIMQSWPLERKIQVAQLRIMEWYERWEGKVYISFSGGKDSTVLLDLARRMYPDIDAVFVDTGLEYPEIRAFVKTKDNVIRLTPDMSFDKVIAKYGYPLISKEVSDSIYNARSKPDGCRSKKFDPDSDYCKKYGAMYDLSKWRYLLDSDIPISHLCCDVMKKKPVKKYEKETGNYPILGTMACESTHRRREWLKDGCNGFTKKRPTSQPISFWTEQDILKYLLDFNIEYSSIYGDIVSEKGKLITTGEKRTGCMFCMFGCHLEKSPNRFQRMKITHPKQYDYCIRPIEENGLGLGKVLDYISVKYD